MTGRRSVVVCSEARTTSRTKSRCQSSVTRRNVCTPQKQPAMVIQLPLTPKVLLFELLKHVTSGEESEYLKQPTSLLGN